MNLQNMLLLLLLSSPPGTPFQSPFIRYGALHFGQRTLNQISPQSMGGISKSGVHLEAVTFTYNLLTFGAVSFYTNKGRNVKVQATPPSEKHTV